MKCGAGGVAVIAAVVAAFTSIHPLEAQTLRSSGAYSPTVGGSVSSRMGSTILRRSPSTLGRGSSVSGDGRGGVSVYNNGGTGRFVGDGSGGGRVYFRDGSTVRVQGDGAGGKTVYLPGNTRHIPGPQGRMDSGR